MRLLVAVGILLSLCTFSQSGVAEDFKWRCSVGLVEVSRESYDIFRDSAKRNDKELCFMIGRLRQRSAIATADCKDEGMDISKLHASSESLIDFCSKDDVTRGSVTALSRTVSDEAQRLFNAQINGKP